MDVEAARLQAGLRKSSCHNSMSRIKFSAQNGTLVASHHLLKHKEKVEHTYVIPTVAVSGKPARINREKLQMMTK